MRQWNEEAHSPRLLTTDCPARLTPQPKLPLLHRMEERVGERRFVLKRKNSLECPSPRPLPTPASWGEEEENCTSKNRRGLRRFLPIVVRISQIQIAPIRALRVIRGLKGSKMAAATLVRSSMVPFFPGAFTFVSTGTESDCHMFLRFFQTETEPLNFFRNLRHVRHSPRYDDVLRLWKLRLDFLQEPPITLPEQVLDKIPLKIGRRRVLHQLQYVPGVQAPGIEECDPVEEINRACFELFDVHIGPHLLFPAWFELVHLLGDTQRRRHSLVTESVRQEMPV